jgi:D-alanyl-D-alanine carboxypeptidase (penicillin-binding protein 5/6)
VSLLASQAPPAAPRPPWRRGRLLAIILPLVILPGLVAALAAAQLTRSVPLAELRMAAPVTLSVLGNLPTLPWPVQGQGRLDVEGLGTLGGSGNGKPVAIGSVAKVMTAYLVLTDYPLAAGQTGPTITVTAADVTDYQSRIPSGQSLVAVVAGEQLTERQALEALLLPSANNIAHLLARWDAGSAGSFVDKMNTTARDLGLSGTHYTDPSGFEPSTVSTAADQTVLARNALRVPALVDIAALPTATLPVVGTVHNFNHLLGTDGVFGIKTGSTDEAGGNLLFAAHLSVAGQTFTVIGAVLNQPGNGTTEQLLAVNKVTRGLLAAVKRVVRAYPVLAAGPVGKISSAWGRSVTVGTAAPVEIVGWPGMALTVSVSAGKPGRQVRAGQNLGTLTVHGGGADATVELRADAALLGPSLWWRLSRTP